LELKSCDRGELIDPSITTIKSQWAGRVGGIWKLIHLFAPRLNVHEGIDAENNW